MSISRRSFLAATSGWLAAAHLPLEADGLGVTSAPLTAGDIIQRIKDHVGVPWRDQTVDNIISGRAETTVKGIATTMMATLDVVQRAAKAGKNMVITHEPTFYSHQDTQGAAERGSRPICSRISFCATTTWWCSASTITGTRDGPMASRRE